MRAPKARHRFACGTCTAIVTTKFVLQLDDATHERQLKLRREVLAVNEDHIRRLSVAMKTKGRATAAILAMVTTCTLTRAKFNEAVAAEAVASGARGCLHRSPSFFPLEVKVFLLVFFFKRHDRHCVVDVTHYVVLQEVPMLKRL